MNGQSVGVARSRCVLGVLVGIALNTAQAHEGHLPEIEVHGPQDASVGTADSASEGAVDRDAFAARPKLRPGDIVEAVPGVVATQHSGDGKANQYFLRGFNLDHGTDMAFTVDGMPVNMPTHGHGQGFADLNFLIPELVSGVRYRKGPYWVDSGNFSLAGNVQMDYLSALDHGLAQATFGPHGYRRALLAGSAGGEDRTWLGALELSGNDGPWDRPEQLRKLNAVLRYSQGSRLSGITLTGMAYDARWNSTDQVPQREIDSGAIGRFGTLDPTDGGHTRRLSLSGKWFDTTSSGATQISAYAIDYAMQLWSNFTYALANPVHGDQFEQTDRRRVFGAQATHRFDNRVAGLDGFVSLGTAWRGDRIDEVGLYLTEARDRYATVRQDAVSQDLLSAWFQQWVNLSERWRAYAGVRADRLSWRVDGREPVYGAANSGRGDDGIASPAFGLAWTATPSLEFYANAGGGFHSNDVRGVTISVDPASGLPVDRAPALVRGRGAEFGWRFAPSRDLSVSVALWRLGLDSELVYVGDAGATEAGRASTRRGVEASLRWKPAPAWRIDVDAAVSRARFRGAAAAGEGDDVDNAVQSVFAAGVLWQRGPWSATARVRYMGPRALVSTNEYRSQPLSVINAGVRHQLGRHLSMSLDVFNLADRRGNDIEYRYASCTRAESAAGCNGAVGTDDTHVHPLEPRTVRLTMRAEF